MPFVLSDPEGHIGKAYKNSSGNAECVEFIQQTLKLPPTSLWVEGAKVTKGTCTAARGTAIATFVGGRYPQIGTTGKHAAIYLEQNEAGIVVVDQWRAQGQVKKRTIRFESKSPSLSNRGDAFSIIEIAKAATGSENK